MVALSFSPAGMEVMCSLDDTSEKKAHSSLQIFPWNGRRKLTQDRIIPAFATSHASLATDMARKARVDDDILSIIIAGRINAADDEELLIAVEGVENILQLGAQSACQGEIPRADSRERQSEICSQSLIWWSYPGKDSGNAYPRSVSCCSRHLQPRRGRDGRRVDPAD